MNLFQIAMNMLLLRHPNLKLEIKIAYNKLKDKKVKNVEEAMEIMEREIGVNS